MTLHFLDLLKGNRVILDLFSGDIKIRKMGSAVSRNAIVYYKYSELLSDFVCIQIDCDLFGFPFPYRQK